MEDREHCRAPAGSRRKPYLTDLKAFPGMDTVTVVRNGHVLIQPFSYSSQALTAVDGLEGSQARPD